MHIPSLIGDNHGGHYAVYINPKGDGKVSFIFAFFIHKISHFNHRFEQVDIILLLRFKVDI